MVRNIDQPGSSPELGGRDGTGMEPGCTGRGGANDKFSGVYLEVQLIKVKTVE